MRQLLEPLSGAWLHPQWLSLRYHRRSRQCLRELEKGVVLDIGSGNSVHTELIPASCDLYRLDYPPTNGCTGVNRISTATLSVCLLRMSRSTLCCCWRYWNICPMTKRRSRRYIEF